MSSLPVSKSHTKIGDFLAKIQQVRTPPSATVNWLKSIGFKSSYDQSLLHVLDVIGFRDESKKPTYEWKAFRDKQNAPRVLAAGIRSGYKMLFDVFDDAHLQEDEALKNVLRPKMDVSDDEIGYAVETFNALCSLADFEEISSNGSGLSSIESTRADNGRGRLVIEPNNVEATVPALHIDIQVHISADASEAQIDTIFESMAKHLYGKTAE